MADRFEVLELLGRGGDGAVYAAVDHATGERVAIKRLLPGVRPPAWPMHPALVGIHGVVELDGADWLVMDFVEGRPLSAFGVIPGDAALAILRVVADGLTALHEAGLVHGDVKPDNVIMNAEGRPVLVDCTPPRARFGTDGYRAPEVAVGAAPSAAADVFGFAATAVATLTGLPPVDCGDAINTVVPAWRLGLATDPARRPTTAALLAAASAEGPTNLPRQAEAEYPEERAWAATELLTCRCLTVTGIGDVAKSRFVAAVADSVRLRYPGGVWRARIGGGSDAAYSFAAALGVPQADAIRAAHARAGALPTLIVLDGTATQGPLGGFVENLLGRWPSADVLVASDGALGVDAERVLPLRLPEGDATTADVLARCPSPQREALQRLAAFDAPFSELLAFEVAQTDGPVLRALVDRGLVIATASHAHEVHASVRRDLGSPDAVTRERLHAWCAAHLATDGAVAFGHARPLVVRAVEAGDDRWLSAVLFDYTNEAVCRDDAAAAYATLDSIRSDPTRFPTANRAAAFADVSNRWARVDEIEAWAHSVGDDGIAAVCRLRRMATEEDDDETPEKLRALIEVFVGVGDGFTEAVAWADLGITLAGLDDETGALDALRRAAQLAEDQRMAWTAGMVHTALGRFMGDTLHDHATASRHGEAAIDWFERAGHRARAAQARGAHASYLLALGHVDEAIDVAERALVDSAEIGADGIAAVVLCVLARAHAAHDPERVVLLVRAARAIGLEKDRINDPAAIDAMFEAATAALGREITDKPDLPAAVATALAP